MTMTATYGYAGPEVAPQGVVGDWMSQWGQPIGTQLGATFGNQGLGSALGGIASQLGRILPFAVDPSAQMGGQVAPQGFFGNLLGGLGGQFLPGPWGGIAQGIGGLLPFSTGPSPFPYGGQMGGQVAPQGLFGSILGGLGGRYLPGPWGGIAQGIGSLLPFSADPSAQMGGQVAPQGLFGNILGGLGGRYLPGPWGGIAQGIGSLLPFNAGPSPFPYGSPYGGQMGGQMGGQVAPQGFFGNLLGGLGGQFLPGPWGGVAQGIGSLLPFQAGPMPTPPYAYACQ